MPKVHRVAVCHHFHNGSPVRHHKTWKLPGVVQNARHQVRMGGGGGSVDGGEGVHEGGHAGVRCRPEGRQNGVPQSVVRKIHRVVVPTAFHKSVARKVLGASGQCSRALQAARQICPLKTLNARFCRARTQPGILAGALHDAAPPGIARHVHHRRKRPIQAVGRGFQGRRARRAAHQIQVPTGGFTQRDGELRAVAVHDVGAKKQGDAQASFPNGHGLQGPHLAGALDVEDGAQAAGAQKAHLGGGVRCGGLWAGGVPKTVVLVHLAHLLLQGHHRQNRINARVDGFNLGKCGIRNS